MSSMTTDRREVALTAAAQALQCERDALERVAHALGEDFLTAVGLIVECRGRIVITGLGKSGHVGAKIAATLSSVGLPALFLHSAEALHGDLGALATGDVLLGLSNSGRTAETYAVARYAAGLKIPIIAVVGRSDSPLAHLATAVLDASVANEADPLGLAPTASTTAALALGDALAAAAMSVRGFTADDFHHRHPGGSLGELLTEVRQ